jgi:hypothetical protein
MPYGPWSPTCPAGERERQLRCLQAIAYMVLRPHHPLIPLLRRAESNAAAFAEALDAVERLPSLHRRRLLSIHSGVTWPRPSAPSFQPRKPYRDDLDEAEPVGKFCDLPSA